MSSEGQNRSTLAVSAETRRRFNRTKPYRTMSQDEFVRTLLDRWEGRR